MIIGVTGLNASGKDTFTEYLVEKFGFKVFSLSDEVRAELRQRHLPITRENLQSMANELRKNFGNDILARRVFEKMKNLAQEKNFVIVSIRHPAEANFFKKQKNFIMVEVRAPAKRRWQWAMKRAKPGEKKVSFKHFIDLEKRELAGASYSQQLKKIFALAKIKIENIGSKKDLEIKAEEFYGKARKQI